MCPWSGLVLLLWASVLRAQAAIRKLDAARLDMKHFSIVGKDDHTEEKAIGFLVGQIMRQTKGRANPELVNRILKEKLAGM